MELRIFAEQVLFGNSLEEKLSFPREAIVDSNPGEPIVTPKEPTRPKELCLKESGMRFPLSGPGKLSEERERGLLLHHFCNHELLATELMALVLLKFPEAPKRFRQGVLETLKEEQIHTQMYLARMKQCGIHFGEIPVNGYFWRNVSSMNDPLDYVSRLSLTFEQANLDYSREYAAIFQEMGDKQTAQILDKIYRDEIEHVGFGLEWFRKWKGKELTDWEAFRKCLPFPLSPGRAKGKTFNFEGRRKAGFDELFIQELSIFTQSRGRTPSVFFFNPGAELSIVETSVDKVAVSLQNDLSTLSFFLCCSEDIVVVRERPSLSFLQGLQEKGFFIPEIVELGQKGDPQVLSKKLDRKLRDLRPWAWSPDSVALLKPLFPKLTCSTVNEDAVWNEQIKNLYAKSFSAELLKLFLQKYSEDEWLAPLEVVGKLTSTLEEVRDRVNSLTEKGYDTIVLKAPFGVAGRNQLRISYGDAKVLSERDTRWIERILAKQGALVVEPWLKRVLDFSVQYDSSPNGLKLIGMTRMLNNERGQFNAAIANGLSHGLNDRLVRFIHSGEKSGLNLKPFYNIEFKEFLEKALEKQGYSGPVGVDAFVYENSKGALKLKPIVELNPRYTMGRVLLELQKHAESGRFGMFQMVSKAQLRQLCATTFSEFSDKIQTQNPVELKMESRVRIQEGSLVLNDPEQAESFLALFHVRKDFSDFAKVVPGVRV